jgi:uncharacterized protein (DUF1800 family)
MTKLTLSLTLAILLSSPTPAYADNALASPNHKSEQDIIHFLNRAGFGARPGEIERVQQMGLSRYLDQQLKPNTLPEPDSVKQAILCDALDKSCIELFQKYGRANFKAGKNASEAEKKAAKKEVRQNFRQIYEQTATARLVRAVDSPRQLQETLVDFWFNHFNIYHKKGLDNVWIGAYEEQAIRPYALGRFRDLLGATAHHPAMLFYLDNWQNTKAGQPQPALLNKLAGQTTSPPAAKSKFKGINENYARELMELHTLGVDGGYTQTDVQELARVLTGLGIPARGGGGGQGGLARRQRPLLGPGVMTPRAMARRAGARITEYGGGLIGLGPDGNGSKSVGEFGAYFDANRHDFGSKNVLGHRIAGSGEKEIEQVLDILAKHPSTAKHICYQLAQYYLADEPPASLVSKMSDTYLKQDGRIDKILETMFNSNEFWDPRYINAKFKSPYRFIISALRNTDSHLTDPTATAGYLRQAGMPLYGCLTPDGYKNTQDAWLNPDALLNRINIAATIGAGRYPGVTTGNITAESLADTFATRLSDQTSATVKKTPANQRVGLLLGSPEFMKY